MLTEKNGVTKPWTVRLVVAGTCTLAGLLLLRWSLHPSPEGPGAIKVLALKAAAGDPKAVATLKDLGPNAVPGLARLLDYQDPLFRVQAWALAPVLPKRWSRALTAKLKPLEASSVRVAAGKSLALLGPQAAGAVPDLLRGLRDPEPYIAMQAGSALGQIGKPSISGLIKALSDKKPVIRQAAAYGLAEAGADGESAILQLIHCLEDPDPEVREGGAYSLSRIGYQVIAVLTNVANHADSAERQSALKELVQFSQTLGTLAPLASKMELTDNADSHRMALGIFAVIHAAEKGAARTLGRALEDPDAGVRLAAVQGLPHMNWRTEATITGLRKRLRDSSAAVREWAARDLGALGPEASAALEDLKFSLQDDEPHVRAAAREAIQKIETTADGHG